MFSSNQCPYEKQNKKRPIVSAFFILIAVIYTLSGKAKAEPVTSDLTLEQTNQPYKFWILDIHDSFVDNSGKKVYLDLTTQDKERMFWDPVAKTFIAHADLNVTALHRPASFPNTPFTLSDGSTLSMNIEASGARCGYAVGVSYIYQNSNSSPESFYIVEKLNPAVKTSYCGHIMTQKYDTALLSPIALSDNRWLLIDYSMNEGRAHRGLVISMRAFPKSIVALGDTAFIIPGYLLQPALDKAGDNQQARYNALLQVLKNQSNLRIPSSQLQ